VFVLSRQPNASYAVVNEVLKQGGSVAMAKDAIATPEGKERGAFVIRGVGRGAMDGLAKKYGVRWLRWVTAPGELDRDQEGAGGAVSAVGAFD
jgi:hypothetical protein